MRRLLVLCFIITLSLTGKGQINVNYWINTGKEKIINNDNLAAIECFNVLIRFIPDMHEAYALRAFSKYYLGDIRGAIDDYNIAIIINPYSSFYFFYRGNAKEKIYDFKGAREDYNKAIELKPNNVDAYICRGINSIYAKKYAEALNDMDEAVKLNDKVAYTFLYRALAKQYNKYYAEALIDYNRAIKMDPKNTDAYVKRGRNKYEMKDFKGAIDDFNKAISIDSTYSYAYFNRAMARYDLKDSKGAMQDYNKVIELDPENALTYYNRAELKTIEGDLWGALDDYDNVIKINPSNIFTYFNRGIIWFRLKRYNKAIEDYTTAIELNPEFALAFYNRAIARRASFDLKGAKNDETTYSKLMANRNKEDYPSQIDSTGIAKLIDFKADFDEGNVQVSKIGKLGIIPSSNFTITYALNDSVKKKPELLNDKLNILNSKGNKDKFILTCNESDLSKDTIDYFLNSANAISDTSMSVRQLFLRAVMKSLTQDYNGALDDYNTIISTNPSLAIAYFNRANTRYELVSVINSIKDFSNYEVILDNNKFKNQIQSQASTHKKKVIQNYDEIIADYRKAILMDPTFKYTYFNLANVMVDSKNFESALANYNKAIELDSKFGEAYYNRGLTFIYLQKTDIGCADLSKAGELGVGSAYVVIKKYCGN